MDDTQRLDHNDDEEETSINRDRPVSNLHMFAGIHGPAQDFPIYYGQNTIGRHASCDITLPAQSVSKKHAILEVRGDCHTVCDNGSLNKTRRGKVALAPNIHYALSHGDFLLFADVACRYTIEEKVEAETTGVEESEDDSVLVPGTQGALAIEKTPGAAIRRIARGAVLAKDSGDEEDEQGQTRWNEAGCGSVKDSHKTSTSGTDFHPDMDTVVPESDEENDTSTSETCLPSLNLQCDSETDTSRRSSFVPSSQNISTPVAQSKNGGRTLTAVDEKEIEAKKPADAEMTPRSAVEDKVEEPMVESTCGDNVSELCVEVAGTVDDKLKKEQECEKMLKDDAIKKPSSDIMPGDSSCIEDNLTSSGSETVQEAPCVLTPKEDDPIQDTIVKDTDTDVKQTEDKAGIQEEDTTTSGTDVHPAKTSGIQANKPEEGGNGRSLGSGGVAFHMDSDTDEDEAAPTGSDLEKSKSPQIAHIEESEKKVSAPPTSRNEEDSDSDTDVESDQNVTQSKSGVEKTVGEPIKAEGTTGLAIDSDTDDDADISKQTETDADQDSRSNTEEKKEEFHLDSDTDVEEDASTAEVKEVQAETPKASVKETKDVLNLDSDTDMDEEVDIPSSDVAHGPQDSSTASTSVRETTGVDSDTDVDEDGQKPGRANVTTADNETKDQTAVSDVVIAKEAAALHVDSDTDVEEDDGLPVAPVTKVGSPEDITDSDGAKKDNEMTKKPADLNLDSDTDMEEGDGPSVDSRQIENQVETSNIQKETDVEDQKPSVSSTNQNSALSGNSTEEAKNVPAEICTEEDETQKSESESLDMEMMPTQCYLEPQEESDLPDEEEEEATQAYIFSSTWAEPDPFKRPADPIGVLQISSVTLNSTEEDIDETALAETQAFCTEEEPIGPSVQETPEPVARSVDETTHSSGSEDESGKKVQKLSHEIMSSEATQPISQCLSTRPSQEAGTWLHLKREVPASVWIRGIEQEASSTNLEGDNETTKDATQTDEQSLKLELEATQLCSEERPSGEEPTVQTETTVVPAAGDENKEPEGPEKPTEQTQQPCSEDTQVTDIDATQAYSLSVPDLDGTTQASSLPAKTTDGNANATSVNTVASEENTQVVNPSIATDEVVVPEMSSKSKAKPSSRKGLSRSKKKEESSQSIPTLSETEKHPDKPSTAPECIKEEPDKPITGESQLSEPEIKEVRRRGSRRDVESLSKATANEDVVATTSQTRTKKSLEDEPRGRKKVPGRSAIKVVNEELKGEHEQTSSNTKELKESFEQEILPVNPPEEIESLTSEDDKGTTVEHMSEESSAQVSMENQEILSAEASTSSTSSAVNEGKELMDSSDNSAEKSHSQHITENKKPTRNKRQAATRPNKEEADETQSVGNTEKEKHLGGRNLRTTQEKNESKQSSESLQSQEITQVESQGRKATRKTRAKASEPELDKSADMAEEAISAEPISGNEKSRRTRRSLKEDIKQEIENLPETKGKTRRSASVKNIQPKNKEQENLEDMPTSNKMPKTVGDNSKEETTKLEQEVKEDVKTEEKEVVRKSRRIQRSQKEKQKTEDNIETQEIPSSDSQTLRKTRRDHREENVVKEENVKETPSRRTRRRSKEEEEVKLEEDQSKKSRQARKDSKEETKAEIVVEQSSIEDDKEETVGRKTTRKTRRNLKEDENTKQTEDNSRPERSSRTRAKTSDESQESHSEVGMNKGSEESHKLSPLEEKSKPQVGRGRRAAKKEDIPQTSTPVASRKRGQPPKAEVEVKRKKSDDEEQEKLGVVETPRSRRGRPRKLVTEVEKTQTEKDISPPDPSPSRSTRQKASSALSNPQEVRTPRRTNRISLSATSPYAQSGSPPKILFTGVVDTAGEETIRSLGGDVADSVFDCTHLVTDRVRRTVKFLCALARGIPIVTLDWIDKCKKSGCFLSPTGFLVNDKEQEKNFSFVLSESLQKAKKHPLFEGYEIHVTANVKPEPDHMKDIIRCSGATFLPKMPRSFKEKCIIVSCPEDAARCKSVPTSVPITSAEFILSGILRQEVNPTAYLLNPAVQDTAPTPAKRRR